MHEWGLGGGRSVSGFLALEDGTVFPGESVGATGTAFGEAVFTTAMTGYQEIATDPSFCGQVVCFTAPMVGNYGVADSRSESARAHACGVVMREARGPEWTDWLAAQGLPALTGLDTRSLTLHLREQGALRCALVAGDGEAEAAVELARSRPGMAGQSLAARVSTSEPYVFAAEGAVRVAVVDYGAKRSILRRLARLGVSVTVFPHGVDPATLAGYDGVVLSNGPGDPEPLTLEVETVRELLGRVPVLGICLGHQLLALATGLKTFKLPFGHRGANHPVLERSSGRVLVTSQNHGFAVESDGGRAATHESLYDGTVEALAYPELRARSVQFHPEAGPGPHDAWPILDEWVEEVVVAAA
ncbi:MAG TPA: glutamine-hydrolyzing carbamoyl-phosphate synthase small subunit [Gaiellaceae bacterium]|nr:glutamine-hydrolyzing carbamoyl-phosphate synthase small subunit [Gaiellaceae bacterium]